MLLKLRYHQYVALLFCVLVLSQQVVGKAERKRYESAFENLFRRGKDAINQLSGFHIAVENNKELHQTMTKIKHFVKTNPDKVGLGIGLAASSWLLYQSVILANETQRFFDEIEELKGQFNKYYLQEVPKLEDLFRKTRDQLYENDQEKRKEHFRTIYKHLMKYFQDLQRIMDNVQMWSRVLSEAEVSSLASDRCADPLVGNLIKWSDLLVKRSGQVTINNEPCQH
ncbi:hypothetical protein AC249_AIPGENE2034 [Exaiptasia diaphana]|nr:hypothetical protein AC249_AIPGENE2034 [Exaiptasia diaphana]